jgi:glycosyltransferase involved in cell wall biosynthesis
VARILLVNQYYWPDFASTGQHLTDLAEHLVRAGHEVRVLASRGRYFEGRGQAPVREERNGVRIRRVRATSFGKRRTLGRLTDYATFHLLLGAHVVFQRWADVVVTLTTPPLLGFWGGVARLLGGPKHVAFLMDLHPDAEVEQGMLRRNSPVGRLLAGLDAWTLRRAERCVVLGPYMGRRVVRKGVSPARITEIPVWSDGAEIVPEPHATNAVRRRLGWERRFVVLYSGNAGVVHGFSELLEAAAELDRTDPDVLFAFVGGGPRTAEIRERVASQGLTNVEFHPYVEREELSSSLAAGDVHFLSLRPPHVGVAVPGKLYGILAAGRPLLFVGAAECESADTVRASGAGFALEPGQGAELARRIRALRDDPADVARRGRLARAYFEAHHDREPVCEAWRALLEEITGGVVHPPAAVGPADVDGPPAALPGAAPAAQRTTTRT